MNAPLNRTKYGKDFDINYARIFGKDKPTMTTIQGQVVTQTDVGRNVTYVPNHAPDDPSQWERGVLSSFREDDGAIFVRFKGPNGERCNPENLRWG